MEARVARLESDVEYIKRDIGELKASVNTLSEGVGTLNTQMATLLERTESIKQSMVTKAQLAIYAVATLITIVGAGWWLVQQYLSPILMRLPAA